MAGQQGLKGNNWDSGTCARMYWGSTVVPFTKAEAPELTVKTEVVREVGSMLGEQRTPGVGEVGAGKVTVLLTRWETLLVKLPRNGFTLVEFTVLVPVSHPAVKSSFGELWDRCRITKVGGNKYDVDEKALVKELEISCVNRFERGGDGVFRSLFQLDSLPMSSSASALTSVF